MKNVEDNEELIFSHDKTFTDTILMNCGLDNKLKFIIWIARYESRRSCAKF